MMPVSWMVVGFKLSLLNTKVPNLQVASAIIAPHTSPCSHRRVSGKRYVATSALIPARMTRIIITLSWSISPCSPLLPPGVRERNPGCQAICRGPVGDPSQLIWALSSTIPLKPPDVRRHGTSRHTRMPQLVSRHLSFCRGSHIGRDSMQPCTSTSALGLLCPQPPSRFPATHEGIAGHSRAWQPF